MAIRAIFKSIIVLLSATAIAVAAQAPLVWNPNREDGSFTNPIVHADYSDPDVVRAGDDYFMVSSSFTAVPGLPVLHSRDLVNWTLVNHALPRLVPEEVFASPQHGAGVWAPAIRHHANRFWIYYPDPDHGIYVITATDPRGRWTDPVLVKKGKGLIDPCPLWDDDGRAYLVHAFARSRAGFANVLHLNRLSEDGTSVLDTGQVVIDGNTIPGYTTLEGPKFYKRNGWYYIFAPAGGVKNGWQSVFRARRIEGPYEYRTVLAQGTTDINGPHQGALVDTVSGEWWFLHFQDAEAYGRIVHMQPVRWHDDWPVMGADEDGDGTGEPRRVWKRPALPRSDPAGPATSDRFTRPALGLQWQWQANPSPTWISFPPGGGLGLNAQPVPANLWFAPNLLLQKFAAPAFAVTTELDSSGLRSGERAGLIVFGADYAWLGVEVSDGTRRLVLRKVENASAAAAEETIFEEPRRGSRVRLRLTVEHGARYRFSVLAGNRARTIGSTFQAVPGRWVGAKIGVFAAATPSATTTGSIVVSTFEVTPPR